MAKKQTVRIENWQINNAGAWGNARLQGQVYGHENFKDGEQVTTSAIRINGAPNYVETENTLYLLGEPMAAPLTHMQAQAVAVVKQALIDDVSKDDGSILAQYMGPTLVAEAAETTAKAAIQALIKSKLLVQ